MVWDEEGLGFKLESGMVVTENDGEVYSAESDELHLNILPSLDTSIKYGDLRDFKVNMANELQQEKLSDAGDLSLGDLYGYYIEGEKEGVKAVIAAMMYDQSAGNYIVVGINLRKVRNKAIQLAQRFYAWH